MKERFLCLFIIIQAASIVGCVNSNVKDTGMESHEDCNALGYYRVVKSSGPEEIRRKYYQLRGQKETLSPVIYAVRLALLLSVPEKSGIADDEQALNLLKDLSTKNISGQSNENNHVYFGLLWREILKERKSLQTTREKLFQARQQLLELKRETESLNHQIEALKTIEQQINQRKGDQDSD